MQSLIEKPTVEKPVVSRKKAMLKAGFLLVFLVGAILFIQFTPVKEYLTAKALGRFLDAAGMWAPASFFPLFLYLSAIS